MSVEATIVVPNISMKEASQEFFASNIGTNQSFEPFNMKLDEVLATVLWWKIKLQ